jgi:hypothetical protein
MTVQHLQHRNGRSLFWPLILIGVGLVWLLSNMGILQPASIGVLFRLWPLILIVIGLDLLFGRRSPALGTLIGVGGVALIIVLMLVGPSLGWVQSAEVKEATYNEPVGDTASATINLDVSVAETNIKALSDSSDLFQADLRYVGDVIYDVNGGSEKTISLRQENQNNSSIGFWDWNFWGSDQNLRWDIGLSTDVPIDLEVNSGVSSSTLDLKDIQLTRLHVNSGVGSVNLTVPAMPDSYDVSISGGTGSTNITVEEGAAINLDITGGVGSVTVDVPNGTAVRLDASTGVGQINVPSDYERTSGDEENFVGDEGIWQSPGYDNADRKITITYDGGVGSFTIN